MRIELNSRVPVHPFLFAIYPILFLFGHNIRELDASVLVVPLAVVSIVTALSLVILRPIAGGSRNASLFVSSMLVLFFSYGPLFDTVNTLRVDVGPLVFGPHRILLLFYGVAAALSAWFALVWRRTSAGFTSVLNIVSLALALIALLDIATFSVRSWGADRNQGSAEEKFEMVDGGGESAPNIYYIILDAYGRSDVLREVYDYDNGEFLDFLTAHGFYVADRAHSNYHSTNLSVGSALDFSYHEDWETAPSRRRRNRSFALLKERGYRTFVASSWDKTMRIRGVDAYHKYGKWLDDFQTELIRMTPLSIVIQKFGLPTLMSDMYDLHRRRIDHVFETVEASAEWEGPFVLYAHVFAPHPPFVFGPNGEAVQPDREFSTHDSSDFLEDGGTIEEYVAGYRGQIEYVDRRLVSLIETLLSGPDADPIIILQGDHGPRAGSDFRDIDRVAWEESYAILNAYRLPGDASRKLYDRITPVNTFRLILNHYFGVDVPLIEDRSYFVDVDREFIDISSRLGKPSEEPAQPAEGQPEESAPR